MTEASSPQSAGPDRLRRWLGPALLISLVINVFLLGMIATAMLVHRPGHSSEFRGMPPSLFGMMRRGAAELAPNDRAFMRDVMVQQFPIIRPYFAKVDAARRDLANVIAVNPYDPVKVGEAFARVDAAQAEMIKATRQAMIEGFGKMSNEQRARLAHVMRKQAERRLSGAKPGEADGPPPPGSEMLGSGAPGQPDRPPLP